MRDLIYSVDKWTSYLFGRLLKESAPVKQLVERGKKKLPTFDSFARELFGRLYGNPTPALKVRAEDSWAKALHESLDDLDAYKKLRAYAAHNKDLASTATATLLEQLVDKLPDPPAPATDPEKLRNEVRGLLDFLKQAPDEHARQVLDQAMADKKKQGQGAVDALVDYAQALDKDTIRQALRASVDAAASDAESYFAAVAGLSGLGSSPANVSEETKALLANTFKASDAMKRLAQLAGRMRRIALNKRRSRTKAAASEVNNITFGNDVARILPHELLKLTDPLLSLDFFRCFLERSLLQYDLTGNEKEGRGPIVVLIDDSDSMDGAPSTFAKATALALADLALADHRACRLIRFSDRLKSTVDLRPGHDSTKALLPFLADAVDGGTNFERPLTAAREAIASEPCCERADVVLITDGEAHLTESFLSDWHARAKRDGLSTYAVHIGQTPPQVLFDLTPSVTPLRALVPEKLDALFGDIVGP